MAKNRASYHLAPLNFSLFSISDLIVMATNVTIIASMVTNSINLILT